ncbi:MAG: hypothetical protein AVDCRST_MAG69-1348 [uncultured Solirubrobacteraceae bacterium]|uniref:Uncharacterized protein n=1 Tax=uncultured Solirubrobacteraceae bacterium TaxID=1162706 RepID=A0A6J4S755_9ACTN|nr:MAG: hypothetical protein AVDCRST_MAG69-1348 [uncultured Solirubrobacteraceae bacterium]
MDARARLARPTVFFFRYGLAAIFFVMGFASLLFAPPASRYEGFSMCVGSALSILLLNFLFRMGAKGDHDRDAEEAARDFYARHGHWPDEAPPADARQPRRTHAS